ncbi:uncharacterized protein GGS25DRAFT_532584 [Hypoxylon fragiforme]|uniref:uncharacterized protein n=1 Tax=Hypoxylon fragiforme TaxID=63214 RepID=UPI0020C69AFB|nr:uncharacterized protein GGS25DRAFT_532584 [Hypoxylon fragiforme]KAI2607436.1 hypothetical protein GGS25DRAFT_532584 [Hypoxylon fragiforme]
MTPNTGALISTSATPYIFDCVKDVHFQAKTCTTGVGHKPVGYSSTAMMTRGIHLRSASSSREESTRPGSDRHWNTTSHLVACRGGEWWATLMLLLWPTRAYYINISCFYVFLLLMLSSALVPLSVEADWGGNIREGIEVFLNLPYPIDRCCSLCREIISIVPLAQP